MFQQSFNHDDFVISHMYVKYVGVEYLDMYCRCNNKSLSKSELDISERLNRSRIKYLTIGSPSKSRSRYLAD